MHYYAPESGDFLTAKERLLNESRHCKSWGTNGSIFLPVILASDRKTPNSAVVAAALEILERSGIETSAFSIINRMETDGYIGFSLSPQALSTLKLFLSSQVDSSWAAAISRTVVKRKTISLS